MKAYRGVEVKLHSFGPRH